MSYETIGGDWAHGFQLTGHGAFQAEHNHECPRCGNIIVKGQWLEFYEYDTDGHSRTEPMNPIVCSAHCKAGDHFRKFSISLQETLALAT